MTHTSRFETQAEHDLARDIAKNHFASRAICDWKAIDPLIQTMLSQQALEWYRDARPVLIAAGWQPPKNTPPQETR